MSIGEIFSICCISLVLLVTMFVCILRDVKMVKESAPYGKKFICEFKENLDKICCETKFSKFIEINIGKTKLKVHAVKHNPTESLEYNYISPYEAMHLYVEDELVAIMHSLKYKYNKQAEKVEFSSTRKREEVIEISKLAANVARNNIYSRYSDRFNQLSFYE